MTDTPDLDAPFKYDHRAEISALCTLVRAKDAEIAKLRAELAALEKATIDRCAKVCSRYAETAYLRASDLAKRDVCKGEEYKLKTGQFHLENLKACEEVREIFGRHTGAAHVAAAIRALPLEHKELP